MGRDLLYKPSVPLPMGDEGSETKSRTNQKLGVKGPTGRDLGGVGSQVPVRPGAAAPAARAQQPQEAGKPQAFKAAYFNQDTSGVKEVNLRASRAAALRGQEGASDLRKVVLPPAIGIDTPDPGRLRDAGACMGLDGSIDLDLENLLGRQGAWTRQKGVTAEMIQARMEELEVQIALRKRAMVRLAEAGGPKLSPTVARALDANGNALEQVDDVVADGAKLVGETAARADGMHARLAKALGIKRSS